VRRNPPDFRGSTAGVHAARARLVKPESGVAAGARHDTRRPVGYVGRMVGPRARRTPKPITDAGLHNVALHYLERFAASTQMVRRVLQRRVERAARAGVAEREPALAAVERVVARLGAAGLLDDQAFAAARVQTLHRRGASTRAIRARLAAQGLADDAIADALGTRHDGDADPELAAALRLARRRRIGPFRTGERAAYRLRDLGVLARAGFAADVARRVIDAEDPATLES
jgi:regulatory protein